MDKIKKIDNMILGIILGSFLGGLHQAFPKFEWKSQAKQMVQPKYDIDKIKSSIITKKTMKDYMLLKKLSGGHLEKEDIFYALFMNEYHPNDTIYEDLRNALVEIYNVSPKDTITLMWIKKLDEKYKGK